MSQVNLDVEECHRSVIQVALLSEWDPIGVAQFPEACDEYDSYVSDIYKLIIDRSSKEEIFAYLWQLETVHMGLDGDRIATERFAERLTRIFEKPDK